MRGLGTKLEKDTSTNNVGTLVALYICKKKLISSQGVNKEQSVVRVKQREQCEYICMSFKAQDSYEQSDRRHATRGEPLQAATLTPLGPGTTLQQSNNPHRIGWLSLPEQKSHPLYTYMCCTSSFARFLAR